MGNQSALILVVALVLIVAGLAQTRQSRRRRGQRGQRKQDRAGIVLVLIGGVLIIIVLATGGLGL